MPNQTITNQPSRGLSLNGRKRLALLGWLVLCFAASGTAAFVKVEGWYENLNRPTWTPPDWVFGPVWSILYTMMAVAAWLVWQKGGWKEQRRALRIFMVQWVLNVLWTPLFFGLHLIGIALIEISLLWLAVVATTISFLRISRLAGALLLPYLAWLSLAVALNFTIWRLNV